jgi:aspartate-semialdehyde dehydrogenase
MPAKELSHAQQQPEEHMRSIDVIVAGATGMVGRKMIEVLEERRFPVDRLIPLASARSEGQKIRFRGIDVTVECLSRETLVRHRAPLALFSAGAQVSREFAPVAASQGALVIDNSSAFRMDPGVPLVVPEVNTRAIFSHHGIIANPNCSTIQMVVALKPLHDRFKIRRIIVSTYQSVTGAGKRGHDHLMAELEHRPVTPKFPARIAFNCIPQIDDFLDDGYTREEHKMMSETRKIMEDDSIRVSATCVRVPVVGGHSESVNVEFEQPFSLEEVRRILLTAPGVVLEDGRTAGEYPMPWKSENRDEVFVGRLRADETVPNCLNMWIVADNLRKGAATNAVQIAEEWLRATTSTSS